ncbi:M1 family metallopeptidase [Pelovirga terrestris]|uniref:M1 family peptidase n=1 Tax=Pelovirga terrestris TaxID=2771352 RepID=A0A8J6R4J3_9BACT|nr:M1 family aminopeptidase [Pelovirga terrestris]MBD1399249.1 M1 family peptidase [Pelovirga terrestris]
MMKRFLLFVLTTILFTLSHPSWAAVEYHLDLHLHPAQHQLDGTATIRIKEFDGQQLQLRLSPEASVHQVRQGQRVINYQFNNGRLTLFLVSEDPVKIDYSATFNDPVPATAVHTEDPSFGISATISPAGSYLSASTAWYPQLNESDISYHLRISAPGNTEAVTSGERLYRHHDGSFSTSAWKIDTPLRGLTLSAGPYQVVEDISGSVPIFAYFYEESAELAPTYLKESRRYLDLYERLFGPYPFAHFAIVENFFPTGYGLPGWTLLGSTVIRLPFVVTTSLGHEIAHSWWGNGVWVDFKQGNWSEGLVTYIADHLYEEYNNSEQARSYRLNHLMTYANLTNPTNRFAVKNFLYRSDRPGQAIGYGKAMMIFHMLRHEVGDEIFWQVLAKMSEKHMFSRIGWGHFAKYFSIATGRDLRPFFDQWISRTDDLHLQLAQVTLEQTDNGWLTRGVLQQNAEPYQLLITIRLENHQEQHRQTIRITSEQHNFSITTPWRPEHITIDPNIDLFRLMDPAEIPSTVASIRGSTKLMAVIADRLSPVPAARRTLLAGLRQADIPVVAADQVTTEQLSRHDLLIFGVNDWLMPTVNTGESLTKLLGLQSAGTALTTESAGVIVTRNPYQPERHAAWFVSDGSEYVASVARRIPHYGRYGQLFFSDGNNQLKELNLPTTSPLQKTLTQDN